MLTSILVGLHSDDELVDGTAYRIQVIGTMKETAFTDPLLRVPTQEAFDAVVAAFADCDGIEVENDDLLSEAQVTLDDFRTGLRRWDVDDLSHRDSESDSPITGL